jgi:hypothetical protein
MRSHALVVGFRKSDVRRHFKYPVAELVGGKCISCSQPVYVNVYGASAIRERDADVCCVECEALYDADINRSLIES